MNALTLNRRRIMLSAAVGASTLFAPGGGGASAQAPPPPPTTPLTGNAGHYRFRVGEISAVVLSDGVIGGPPRVYASDASEAELQEVLRRAFLPTDHMTLNLNTLLIETGGRRILVEAGAGATMGPNGGRIFQNLAAIGLGPADIDAIVISHTHPDHVGNLRTATGGRAFPRATVFVPRADWDFFVRNDPDLSYMPVPEDFRRRFAAAIKSSLEPVGNVVELYEAGAEIVPGLTTIVASGHTPGMATFLVHSGNDQLLLTADLAYHPVVNVDNPWRPGPDRDKDTALASRRRIFDRAAADRIPVLGFHFPFPGLGRMLKTDGGYAWVPANWQF
ncbi:MBL fold metallo-hydrolase (plasmid) [Azospirillum brasilense]|uniref:MBL fold metallo-hydrolase n=1 Tax=Azospirillum brasilense TaxID=192 RepID=A0A4D8QZZ7_AZOBR|nr:MULTISPECIES: MBL fold metallo-hydrolase [Azospirillum]MDW7554475.1 MBL fold metallo-hydrolase [Azospirillum brasilense]MDW7556348.1 MBL fold metallo-hydrolase [Azospirillum brasilense]MDW7594006.1 MBL fold metallo-hydrolase [Azospirillum brasilense]MDW7632108.1 MBL fold metallo-hydrolase [Azospirillum brasilense]MDX5950024.1 MBL fold metallo-hydrolase [Azospirillum brasilense]